MKRFLSKIVSVVFVFAVCISSVVSAANSLPLEAYGLNTVAGYSTYVRTSLTVANSAVVFDVTDPSGEVVSFSAVSNSNGVAQAEVSDYYTRRAGEYYISARLENGESNGRVNSFFVYADELSTVNSSVSPEEYVVRSYADEALITVKLADGYGNPIDGHLVKLISSSKNDLIEVYSESEFSDDNGEIVFSVSSEDSGAVTYTVFDVTAGEVLDSRARVVYADSYDFVLSNEKVFDYSYASLGNSSLAVDTFEFENVPDSIGVGEDFTFTLSARDIEGQVVTGYDGTVRFSIVGNNSFYANLPGDYTFDSQDLGTHTFSLAMSFVQAEVYKVEARDTDNVAIFGEYDFVVGGNSGPSSNEIVISNPSDGTYSNPVQVISGSAPAASQLKIFDNDVELASLFADAQGNFSYTTGSLADGAHRIYVASVNGVGTITATSSTVVLSIDTAGPEAMQIVLEPSGSVDPGGIVSVKLFVAEELAQAALLFNGNIFEMTWNPAGYYEGSFAAPIEFGDYKIDFVIVDELGNESKIEDGASVNVGGDLSASPVVGDVTGLVVDSSDHRVTLNWGAVNGDVKNYRVYYGISPNQLTEAVDTFTSTPTWYIPNLKNGVEYFFAVVAVDQKGDVSVHFSNIVSSVPGADVVDVPAPDVQNGTAGSDALEDLPRDASESGPEMLWLILFSLIAGGLYAFAMRRRELMRGDF